MNVLSPQEEKKIKEQEELMIVDIAERLKSFGRSTGDIIPVLQIIQNKYSYLSKDTIKLIADYIGITSSEVYDVATFYNQFRLKSA